MQQADGDTFDLLLPQHRDQGMDRGLIQRAQDLAGVVQPFRDRQA